MNKDEIKTNVCKMAGVRVFETKLAYYYFKISDCTIRSGFIQYKRSGMVREVTAQDAKYFLTKTHLFTEITIKSQLSIVHNDITIPDQ